MRNGSAVALGILLILIGGLWTAQGLGLAGGSPMTGEAVWAIVGPAIAGFGIALLIVQRRRP